MKGAFISALTALAASSAGAADDNPLHTFSDWVVGCDNGRSCRAVGQFKDNDVNMLTIVVDRGPLPGDRPVIWFRGEGAEDPLDFSAGGKPLGLKFVARDENSTAIAPQSTDRALTAILGAAEVKTIDKPGAESYVVSTDGASAALRWMDVVQRRDGTVTALVAEGPKPASSVPPPPVLPTVVRRMPAKLSPPASLSAKAVSEWREKIFECEDETPNPDLVESKRLDAKTTLVMITASCASGAYNYIYIPLLLRPGQSPAEARFEDRDSSEDGEGLYNLYWKDENPRVLASYMKGRGLGDCGGGTDWVWDGSMFRIVAQSMMDDCRGAPAWITYYRARIVDK